MARAAGLATQGRKDSQGTTCIPGGSWQHTPDLPFHHRWHVGGADDAKKATEDLLLLGLQAFAFWGR